MCKCVSVEVWKCGSERLFSYAGQVATDRRGSLLPERLHRILFLRENLVMLNFRLEW